MSGQDAKAAQAAVTEALRVLNEFYAKAGGAAYEGMASGGVIGMHPGAHEALSMTTYDHRQYGILYIYTHNNKIHT